MSAAEGGVNGRAAVRVVIISTQYIETDPANFKSVVQRLTGKDSHGIHCNRKTPLQRGGRPRPLPSVSEVAASNGGVMVDSSTSGGCNNMNLSSSPSSSIMLSRGVSVSDLDKLHTLPSWEEISHWCM